MVAEEEEEGGGEVTLGGVQVQAQPKVKKEKVRHRVCEDCCSAGRPFWQYPPSLECCCSFLVRGRRVGVTRTGYWKQEDLH